MTPAARDRRWSVEAVIGLVVLIAAGLVAWVGLSVPFHTFDGFRELLLGVLGTGVLFIVVASSLVRGHKVRAALVVVVGLAATSVAFSGESIRWRWSRAQLIEVAMAPEEWSICGASVPCRVGWWKIGEVRALGSVVYMQSPAVVGHCLTGGIALPLDGSSVSEVSKNLAEEFSGFGVEVSDYRDGWLSVCLYS